MKLHRHIGTITIRSPGINRITIKERKFWIRNHGTTKIKNHGTRIINIKTKSQNLRINVLL